MDQGILEEIEFWDGWFAEKGGIYSEEYKRRANPNLEFDEHLKKFISDLNPTSIKILDAGSGPVSSLGKTYYNTRLDIKAVDPLAPLYHELYLKHSYDPILPTEYGDFLKLSEKFGENYFDFVYSRNSLDHCKDPIQGILELIKVCKPDRYIFFENAEAEATREKGMGLHQWDFLVENNDLVVQNFFSKEKTFLKNVAENLTNSIIVTIQNEWISVEIKK